ncbi:MAG: hypothetical protein IKR44_00930 [Bacteroidales bacterium]|jgi:hypothetical protein|nr:hypothetical protein [Bacteroidales bacterium]
MRKTFAFTYILLVIAQMILSNYFHFTPLVMLTILPVMILCIPTKVNTFWAMVIAFATGLAVDWLAEGTLGINAMSLVPVAFVRKTLIGMIFGIEPFEQKENLTIKKYGFARMSFAILILTALFLVIYILADCAGTRPLWFIGAKAGLSLVASYIVSILVVNLLSYDDRR